MSAAVSFSPPDRNYVQFSNRFHPHCRVVSARFKEADIDPDSLFRARGWSFCRVRTGAPLWLRSSYCLADGGPIDAERCYSMRCYRFPNAARESIPCLPPSRPRTPALIQFTDPTALPSHSAGCSTRQIGAPSFSRHSAVESQAGDKKRKVTKY